MSKTLNEMVKVIVDYCGSITRAADEIGVHYNTLDRLLKDETATARAETMEKIEAIYDEIPVEEDWEEEEELEEKIEKLEVGRTYEIRIPKSKNGNVVTLLQGTVKGEYRQFHHLDDNGNNVTVLKADLINKLTTVREIDTPVEEPAEEEIIEEEVEKEPVLSGYELYEMLEAKKKAKKKAKKEIIEEEPVEENDAPEEIVEETDETSKMIEELTEEPVEEEESIPTIIGTTPAERLHSCLFLVELCDQKIAEAEKARKDRAAILPMMDKIYEEFRGGGFDGSHD